VGVRDLSLIQINGEGKPLVRKGDRVRTEAKANLRMMQSPLYAEVPGYFALDFFYFGKGLLKALVFDESFYDGQGLRGLGLKVRLEEKGAISIKEIEFEPPVFKLILSVGP